MLDISQYLFIILLNCYFLIFVSQTILAKDYIQINRTNHSQVLDIELLNETLLDHEFFSYDIIDHRTLLVKFDLNRTRTFQQSNHLYYAQIYISKIPAINYRINIGLFLGYYEKEIDATITDHLTFCLVLISQPQKNKYNLTKTIFHRYLKPSSQNILHYCTKIGPIEDSHRHSKKQGSQGDYILLFLQVFMIGMFLIIIQLAHMVRNQKNRESHRRLRRRLHLLRRFQREHPSLSHNRLALLRFISIHEQESQGEEQKQEEAENEDEDEGEGGRGVGEEIEEEEENLLTSSYRDFPSPATPRIRYRSGSPTFKRIPSNPDDSSIEHILEAKPWLQISK